ncbi:MAG: hypothetical protein Q4E61_00975, partial [Alphaproteobacteria bacterium]|nr:hypothetical protein [Alphaproteobacteria bacterium]
SPITFGKSLTIQGGTFVINTPNFSFSKGSSFFLKAPTLTYSFKLAESTNITSSWKYYFWDVKPNDGTVLNCIYFHNLNVGISKNAITTENKYQAASNYQKWDISAPSSLVRLDTSTGHIDYSALVALKDSNEEITGIYSGRNVTNKEAYEFLSGIESGKYTFLGELEFDSSYQ